MWRSMGGLRSRAEPHPAPRAVGPREGRSWTPWTMRARQSYERARPLALALSDGVFAIIITLLVLEIHVPDLAQVSRSGGPRGDPAVAHGLPHQLRGGRDRLGGPSGHLLVDPTDRPSSRVAQHRLPATAVHPSVWGIPDRAIREGAGSPEDMDSSCSRPRYLGWACGGTRAGGRISCSPRSIAGRAERRRSRRGSRRHLRGRHLHLERCPDRQPRHLRGGSGPVLRRDHAHPQLGTPGRRNRSSRERGVGWKTAR